LVYLISDQELYKWAFYLLTDGFFLVQVVFWLAWLAHWRNNLAWPIGAAILWYSLLHSRPTGLFLIPATTAFALLSPFTGQKRFLLGLMAVSALWIGVLVSGRSDVHTQWAKRNFVHGHLLDDARLTPVVQPPFEPADVESLSTAEICFRYLDYCLNYYSRKALIYIWPVFPKYSVRHKIFNALYFGSLIIFSLWGAIGLWSRFLRLGRGAWHWLQPQGTGAALYALCALLLLTACVFHTLTHIDPDTRNLIVWTAPWIIGACLQWELKERLSMGRV
jgi:hypothetical protein